MCACATGSQYRRRSGPSLSASENLREIGTVRWIERPRVESEGNVVADVNAREVRSSQLEGSPVVHAQGDEGAAQGILSMNRSVPHADSERVVGHRRHLTFALHMPRRIRRQCNGRERGICGSTIADGPCSAAHDRDEQRETAEVSHFSSTRLQHVRFPSRLRRARPMTNARGPTQRPARGRHSRATGGCSGADKLRAAQGLVLRYLTERCRRTEEQSLQSVRDAVL